MDRIIPRHLRLNVRENETGREDMGIWVAPQHRTRNPAGRRTAMDPRARYYLQRQIWRVTRLRLSPTPA